MLLPFRIFSKDQRVSHTAMVENKRLGHALTIVKAQQDLKLATKVMTNSEEDGDKKRPRITYGPDFDEKTRAQSSDVFTLQSKAMLTRKVNVVAYDVITTPSDLPERGPLNGGVFPPRPDRMDPGKLRLHIAIDSPSRFSTFGMQMCARRYSMRPYSLSC